MQSAAKKRRWAEVLGLSRGLPDDSTKATWETYGQKLKTREGFGHEVD